MEKEVNLCTNTHKQIESANLQKKNFVTLTDIEAQILSTHRTFESTKLLSLLPKSKHGVITQLHSTATASIILRFSDSSSSPHLIAWGMGTRTLPQSSIRTVDEGTWQIRDQHAEVMARRGLNKWILDEIGKCERGELGVRKGGHGGQGGIDGTGRYFVRQKGSRRFRLREGVKVWMVCSKMPCGDMSIFCGNEGNDGCEKGKMSTFTNGMLYSTYVQQIENSKQGSVQNISEDGVQAKGKFRLKPARKDMPLAERYPSLSCSDKLLRWKLMGLQNKHLSSIVSPIRIDHLLVPISSQFSHTDIAKLHKNLEDSLSFEKRLIYPLPKPYSDLKLSHPFLPTHHTSISLYLSDPPAEQPSAAALSYSLIFSAPSLLETINPKTGLREGASLPPPTAPLSLRTVSSLADPTLSPSHPPPSDWYLHSPLYCLRGLYWNECVRRDGMG